MAEKLEDSRPLDRITLDIQKHLRSVTIYKDRDQIIELILEAFAQDPMTATAPVLDDDVEIRDLPGENGDGVS
ncbi:hypothetical protein ACCT28_20135 [Rhizobium ruizarguesonis]